MEDGWLTRTGHPLRRAPNRSVKEEQLVGFTGILISVDEDPEQ